MSKIDPEAAALMSDAPAPLLSSEEIQAARAVAAKRVREAMKADETDRIIAEETLLIKRQDGKRTGKPDMDELVSLLVELPEFSASIRINGEVFFHGHTYKLPRHVAQGIRETMQNAQRHQMELDGKSKDHMFRQPAMPTLSGIAA